MDQLAAAGQYLGNTVVPRVTQGAGLGLDLVETLRSLENPGGFMQQQAYKAAALQDPTMRAQIASSPFMGGFYGLPLMQQATDAAPGGPSLPTPTLVPSLPALSPQADVSNRIATAEQGLLSQPGATEQAARGALHFPPPLDELFARSKTLQEHQSVLAPGESIWMNDQGHYGVRFGSTFKNATFKTRGEAVAAAGDSGLVPVGTDTTGYVLRAPHVSAGSTAQANADVAARTLGFQSSTDPNYIAFVRQQAGMGGPGAPAPTAAPAAPAATPAPLPIPDDTKASAIPLADDVPPDPGRSPGGGLGNPPPAFLDNADRMTDAQLTQAISTPLTTVNRQAQVPPKQPLGDAAVAQATPAPSPTAPPTAPALPPGTTRTMKLGPNLTIKQTTPKVSAMTARTLAGESTASQAARAALDILRKGPQHDVTAFGMPLGRPGSLAGPVTGRALTALGTVSGQPLAVEEANLNALVAHAKTGVFGITGLRPNVQTLAMFDPLMPSTNQPPEILAMHLERLANFYDSLTAMQSVLTGLTDEQKLGLVYQLFSSTMTQGANAPVIDLRRPAASGAAQ